MLKQENAEQYVNQVQEQSEAWAVRAQAVLPELTFGLEFDREVVFWWKRAEALNFRPCKTTGDAWERICKRVSREKRDQRTEQPKDFRTWAGLVGSTLGTVAGI